jgi:VWFA-related protein
MRVLALLLLPFALHAQTPAQEPSFSGSLDVREAEVEVVISGRDGRPVPGLTREDFQVLEDGRPAEVTQVSAATARPLVLAVFLDGTSLGAGARSSAVSGLRRFFASELRPGDRVLLAGWDGTLAVQGDPTGDAAALGALLDRLGESLRGRAAAQERGAIGRELQQARPYDDEPGNGLAVAQAEAVLGRLRAYSQERSEGTRATLGALQQTLALIAGRPERKALLYVGGGLPLRPGADLFDAWGAKYGQLASRLGFSSFEAARLDATPLIQQTVERANAAGLSIYALALRETGEASAEESVRTAPDPEDAGRALRALAQSTGGRVTTDVQNPAAFLAGTERDLAGAYSLSYAPPPGGGTGSHKVEIRVRNGQLAARYREERRDADARTGNPLLQRALAALGGAGAANPLRAELGVEEEIPEPDGRLRLTAVVSLPLAALTVQPQEHYHVAHLTLAVAARDGKGKVSGIPHAEVPVEIPHERLLAAPGESAGYRFTLHLAPGESVVAVALRDDSSGAESVVRAVYKESGKGFAPSPAGPAGGSEGAARPAAAVAVESAALLMSGQEGGEVPLNALALYLPGEAGKARVLVRMRMDGPALLAGQAGDALRIETALYVLDSGGGISASALETVGIDLAQERKAVETSGVDLLAGFDLKPGAYGLRLLARNAATGRLGVRTFPLAVPDPAKLEALPLSPPPAVDPRPTVRLAGLGPVDPPPFGSDAAPPAPGAAPAPALPDTAEGRQLRSTVRASYREALAKLAGGQEAEALAALAALEDALLLPAHRPASVEQVVDAETGAARELTTAAPECLLPLLRLHQRLYEAATARRRHPGSTVAQNVTAALLDLYRQGKGERAREVTATFGIELLRNGISRLGDPAVRSVLADDPANEMVLLELAVDSGKRGRHAEAVSRLEDLLRAHPDDREARLRLAVELERLGRKDEAERRLLDFIHEETGGWLLSLAYQELARVRLSDGLIGFAERTLREGLQRLPGDEKLTLLLTAVLDQTFSATASREVLGGLKPEGDGGGGAARHRYNSPPQGLLEAALESLDREAASRRPALASALEKTAR